MHLPVKRVEIHTEKQKYGNAGSASTCNSGDAYEKHSEIRRQNKDTLKHSSATGTGQRETRMAVWRGQVQNFDPLGRRDSGHVSGKILKMRALRDLSHDMNLPRPPFNDTSWQETYYSIN